MWCEPSFYIFKYIYIYLLSSSTHIIYHFTINNYICIHCKCILCSIRSIRLFISFDWVENHNQLCLTLCMFVQAPTRLVQHSRDPVNKKNVFSVQSYVCRESNYNFFVIKSTHWRVEIVFFFVGLFHYYFVYLRRQIKYEKQNFNQSEKRTVALLCPFSRTRSHHQPPQTHANFFRFSSFTTSAKTE